MLLSLLVPVHGWSIVFRHVAPLLFFGGISRVVRLAPIEYSVAESAPRLVREGRPMATDTTVRPFRIDFPEEALDDMRRRISATRWPERETVTDDSQGVPLAMMQDLARYWGEKYDWRTAETKLNALPQFVTEIDGLDIHFIHVRSRHEDALPLIITHGWPGSIIEQLKVIEPLTDPTAHGGGASDAFHLVIPSLPGYGFSGKPTATGWDPVRTARAWVVLMKRLGYTRFVAQGGDWGAAVTQSDGRTGTSRVARHSFQHAGYGSARSCQGLRARRPAAIGSLRRGAACLRAAEQLLRQARGLCAVHDDTAPNAVRTGGLTRRPRGVHA